MIVEDMEELAEIIRDKNINDCNINQLMHDQRASLELRFLISPL